MKFTVTAIDAQGTRMTFEREAEDAAALRSALRAEAFVVVAIENASARKTPDSSRRKFALLPVSALDAEMGLRQIAAMLRGGVTLLSALEGVAAQAMREAARRMWRDIARSIESGSSLAAALAPYSNRVGEITVALAAVGERTGELAKTLARAADQLEAKRSLRTTVVNALAYPVLAVVMTVAVSAYLVVGVIPKLAEFLRSGGVALPSMTQMLMDVSDFARFHALSIAGAIAAVAAAWFAMRLFAPLRELEDAMLLRLPVAGRILRLAGTALFARSMQIMTEAGVTLTDALGSAAGLLANRRLRHRVNDAEDAIVRGRSLGDALAAAREFMPMMVRMAAIGEASGALPEAFAETARFHESALSIAVKRFGMLIEPVMICVTGAIVGFVYISFFVALFAISGMN